jgi:hypothetical protein
MSDDLAFEREKWLAETEFRRAELRLREREQENRDSELRLKEKEIRAAAWRNPLTVAVFAAAVAGISNAIVASVNGSMQRELEDRKRSAELGLEQSKAESTRILEMIKTGDSERAAANLDFLLQAGLIGDASLSGKVATFLRNRKPGSGPSLPSSSGRLNFEKSDLLTDPLRAALEESLSRYFKYLDGVGFPSSPASVSVVISSDLNNAYYDGTRIVIDQKMADDQSVALREYSHHILIKKAGAAWEGHFAAIESGLADYFTCSFLNNPKLGEKAVKLYDPKAQFIRSMDNKRTYLDLPDIKDMQFRYVGAEVWGGLFWLMRDRLGAAAADRLIASVWLGLELPKDDLQLPKVFIAALTKAANDLPDGAAEKIRAAMVTKKLPVH